MAGQQPLQALVALAFITLAAAVVVLCLPRVAGTPQKVLVAGLLQHRKKAVVAMAVRMLLGFRQLLTRAAVVAVVPQTDKQAAQVVLVSSSSKQTNNEGNMATKIYRLYGIDTAMHLLRPGAKWEISNSHFSRWEDSRPCPKWEEVLETMEKIKAFEDSINTVWLPEQIEALTGQAEIQAQVDRIIEEQKAA
jgi:hypothetical protein